MNNCFVFQSRTKLATYLNNGFKHLIINNLIALFFEDSKIEISCIALFLDLIKNLMEIIRLNLIILKH